jgi:hypothetical protein
MYLIHNHCIKFFVNCSAGKGSLIGNKKCDLSISFMSSKYKNPSFTKNIKILHLPQNIKILHLQKYKNPSFTKKYKNPSFTKNI